MTQTIHTDRSDAFVDSIVRASFPSYTGKTVRIQASETVNCASYWDGGSRDYFVAVDLGTLRASAPAPTQSGFDRPVQGLDSVPVPVGGAIVEHSIFCGKDMGVRIHVHADTLAGLLPPAVEVSRECRIVLAATQSLKSSYGGVSDFRYHKASKDTGITREVWDSAVVECQSHGWLNKAKAITNEGRNIIGNTDLYQLRTV